MAKNSIRRYKRSRWALPQGSCRSIEDIKALKGKIDLEHMTVQLLGHNRPLEQTSSGHPITDLTEYPEDVNQVTSTASGEQVPGVPETTQVNEVELDAEARSSDLETDTSEEEYSENEEKFSDYYSDGETETTDHSGVDMSETDSELESEDNDTAFTYQQDMKK